MREPLQVGMRLLLNAIREGRRLATAGAFTFYSVIVTGVLAAESSSEDDTGGSSRAWLTGF